MSPATSHFLGPNIYIIHFLPFISHWFFIRFVPFFAPAGPVQISEGTEQRTEHFLMWRNQSLHAFRWFFKQQYAGRVPSFTPLHVVATRYYTEYTILCILRYAVRAYRSINPNTNTSSHSRPRTPKLASWPLRMQFVRTARSKHKTPPRTLGREASRRSHFVCSSCVPLKSKHKISLLALSTEDGGPYVVDTWYVVLIVCSSCVPLNSNANTSSHSPRRTGVLL